MKVVKAHNIKSTDLPMDEIVSIEFIGENDTIDIEVEDTHMFFANGIYTHNSSNSIDVTEGHHVSDSYKKIMTVDFALSINRQLADKTANTARVHIAKNRMGEDGQTYNANFNVSIGKLELLEPFTVESQQVQQTFKNNSEVDSMIAGIKKNLLDKK